MKPRRKNRSPRPSRLSRLLSRIRKDRHSREHAIIIIEIMVIVVGIMHFI